MLSPLPQTPSLLRSSLSYDTSLEPPQPLNHSLEDGNSSSSNSNNSRRRWRSSSNATMSDTSANVITPQQQRDERVASALFMLVGIGYLFPFSALTQPVDYWHVLFPDYNIEFALTSTFMYTNLVVLALIVLLSHNKPWFAGRILGGFSGQLAVLVFIPSSYFFLSSEASNTVAVLGGTAVAAIATAFIDSATIALVAQFPLRVQESFQFGVGLSSLIGSLYRDATKLLFPPSQLVLSTLLYFYTGALTIALCIVAYIKLEKLELTQTCVSERPDAGVELTETSRLLTVFDAESPTSDTTTLDGAAPTKWSVLRKVVHLQVQTTLVFVCSLALWPPLVTEIQSTSFPELQASGWWSLMLLTTFSIADCVGRFLVRYRCGLTPQNIWIVVVARFALIPLLVGVVKGVWCTADGWSVLFVAILGHSNGFIGTLTIIFVTESVHADEQALAGSFTSFFLNLGLVLGASAGLFLEALVL